jgi:hypothetical protein
MRSAGISFVAILFLFAAGMTAYAWMGHHGGSWGGGYGHAWSAPGHHGWGPGWRHASSSRTEAGVSTRSERGYDRAFRGPGVRETYGSGYCGWGRGW